MFTARYIIVVSFHFILSWAYGQAGVFEKGTYDYSVADCFKNKKYSGSFKPDSLPPNHILKGVRIWRTIDLDQGPNKELFNSNRECLNVGLLEIIKFGLLEKKLNAFSSDNFANVAKTRLNEKGLMKQLVFRDTSVSITFDQGGNELRERNNITRYLMGSDIKSYLLEEDWIVNSYSGKTEKYIIAFAPLYYNAAEDKVMPLFWLYYTEWKELLSSFEARNFYSFEAVSFRDVFEKRYFFSRINKESNVYDRSIKDVKHGLDADMESERIKEKLRNSESDLFEY